MSVLDDLLAGRAIVAAKAEGGRLLLLLDDGSAFWAWAAEPVYDGERLLAEGRARGSSHWPPADALVWRHVARPDPRELLGLGVRR